jgi:hypothetical protein
MTSLKGIDPEGSQRAWDLFVKSSFLRDLNPDRPLILASGTPITNTLGEMFTIQRFMRPDVLRERSIHEFDAWAACFGDTTTELELQPSGAYKAVTRFAEFVNVADLMAMFRDFADVVTKQQLSTYLRLPSLKTGKRQILTYKASPSFKAYQRHLAERINIIEQRKGRPQKGQDILLSVITDGRHAAIDLRFVHPETAGEPGNKLNGLIDNTHRIWLETAGHTYRKADGTPHPDPGAAQMIFSDLGTEAAAATRSFSAYSWIRQSLIARGIPSHQIAFMQDYKKSSSKQRLFQQVNSGQVRILIGSTQTMGTGVNAQMRLKALHHLDVPWLPSDIEQREGRIERQGNQNDEIDIYAYATTGSVDATGWQLLERKIRFINAALEGDASIRRVDDVGSQVNQFAMAKALASGDPRLMQKSGLEAEISRLDRLKAAHFDDQHAIRRQISQTKSRIEHAERRITQITEDLAVRQLTHGDAFKLLINEHVITERKIAGASLLSHIRLTEKERNVGQWTLGRIGGFDFKLQTHVDKYGSETGIKTELWIDRVGMEQEVKLSEDTTPLGLIARLEALLDRFDWELKEEHRALQDASNRLPGYLDRLNQPFGLADELAAKREELHELEHSLAATAAVTDSEAQEMTTEE